MTFAAATDVRTQLEWVITTKENDLAMVDCPPDCTYCTIDECSIVGAPSDSKHPVMPIATMNMPIATMNMPKGVAALYWASNSKLP